MLQKTLFIVLVSAGCWAVTASDAHAQRPSRSVSRPALSPYLNMFRGDLGFTDPYNSFVRPNLPQSQPRTRRDLSPATGAGTALPQTTEVLRARALSQRQTAGGIAPTGTGSTFMNLGHFYQVPKYRR